MNTAVFFMLFFSTVSCKFPTVHLKIFSSSHVALTQIATGVFSLYPPQISSFCKLAESDADKYIAIVALCEARLLIDSFSGTFVFPDIRVMINVCDTSGRVYSALSDAAAPNAALTPGVISYSKSLLSCHLNTHDAISLRQGPEIFGFFNERGAKITV